MSYPYHVIVNEDGRRTLSIFLPDERPIVVTGDHPNYEQLIFEAELGESPSRLLQYYDEN